MTSYPIAVIGSLAVGFLESYSSFWASAFKESIVFSLIIPVLLWRSLTTHRVEEEDELMMRRALILTALVLLAVAPLVLPEFQVTLLNYIGLASIVTLGLVLLTGIGGLTSFGQAAFVGLGAYTTAVLTTQYGVSPWLTLPAGLALTFVVALLPRLHHAAAVGALPAARHDCLGHRHLFRSSAISTCSASIPASPRFRR